MSRLKKKIKILITGAAGYIGKYLVLNLKKKNNLKLILIDKKIRSNIELFKGLKYIRSNLCKNIDATLLKIKKLFLLHQQVFTNQKMFQLKKMILKS